MISLRRFGPSLLCLALVLIPALLQAQPEYQWTVYSAVNSSQAVAFDAEGRLWAATTGGVIGYDIAADSIQVFHTKDELFPDRQGLLSLNSTAIAFDPQSQDMYVGSNDGLVSIRRKDGSWGYSAEIGAMTDRPSRLITGFAFNGGRAYFLTAFGIGVFRPSDSSFVESYLRFGSIAQNTPVRAVAFWKDRIWVGTDNGLASAPAGATNLPAPDAWTVHPRLAGHAVLSLAALSDSMLVGTDTGAYFVGPDGGGALRSDLPTGTPVFVATSGTATVASTEVSAYRMEGGVFASLGGVGGIVRGVAVGPDGVFGFGTRDIGLAYWRNGELAEKRPNSPAGNFFGDLASAADGSIWTANSAPSAADVGFSRLADDSWTVYNRFIAPQMVVNGAWHVGAGRDNEVIVGLYGNGALSISSGQDPTTATVYDETNTPLRGINGSPSFVLVAKAVTDLNGRTWMVNFDPTAGIGPVLVLRLRPGELSDDGTEFLEFVAPFNVTRSYRWLAIDDNGTKWLGSDAGQAATFSGLLFLNDRGTPLDISDDRWGRLTTSDGLSDNQQTALVVDKLGELWIGSPKGLSVLVNPTSVALGGNAPVFRTIRALNDIPVKAVAVDALNRKWIGSDQGLFLLSAEGDTVIRKFTVDNSPLVNNQIRSILSVEATGDIYIGTANGMSKVRTVAEAPKGESLLEVAPQPFVLPSSEQLRIKGLPPDATVKILAAGGVLIREFPSPGGAVALWDGRDDEGNLVPSGVYIIVASSRNGDATVAGKVAVIRQ